jgi:hypothetical protein
MEEPLAADVRIFEPDEAARLLERLGVPAPERVTILADRPVGPPERDTVESYARVIVESIGTFDELPGWPSREDFLYVWVFLAASLRFAGTTRREACPTTFRGRALPISAARSRRRAGEWAVRASGMSRG